jgi:hypothetical protein
MNLTQATPTAPVRVPANHTVTKRLGNWTTARRFQVRAHRGHAVLDLRSPQIPAGDIEVEADLDHARSSCWSPPTPAMFSREYWADLRRAHKEGGFPTVDDPTRTA